MLATIHQHDVDIGLGQEGVGEGEATGPGTHDEVVGLDVHRLSCHEARSRYPSCRVQPMKITEVTGDVFAVEGHAANWTLIAEGDALTLVDAGYPGYHDDVLASISEIGHRLDDVEAVLITHAHIDHIGSLPRLLEKHPVPVLLSPSEAGHARREYLEQAGTADVVRNLW